MMGVPDPGRLALNAITIKQAIIIAVIFEFLGAWLAGGEVTATIRGGIVDPDLLAAEHHRIVAVEPHRAAHIGCPVRAPSRDHHPAHRLARLERSPAVAVEPNRDRLLRRFRLRNPRHDDVERPGDQVVRVQLVRLRDHGRCHVDHIPISCSIFRSVWTWRRRPNHMR